MDKITRRDVLLGAAATTAAAVSRVLPVPVLAAPPIAAAPASSAPWMLCCQSQCLYCYGDRLAWMMEHEPEMAFMQADRERREAEAWEATKRSWAKGCDINRKPTAREVLDKKAERDAFAAKFIGEAP